MAESDDDDGDARRRKQRDEGNRKPADDEPAVDRYAPKTRKQKALAALDAHDIKARLRKLPMYREQKTTTMKSGGDVVVFSYGDPINRGSTYAEVTVSFQRFDSAAEAAEFAQGLGKAMKGRAAIVSRGGDRLLTITCHRARSGHDVRPTTCKPSSPVMRNLETALLQRT